MKGHLEEVLAYLWRISRFTSYFYQMVQFSPSTSLPTLGLDMSLSRFTLFYNPEFIARHTADELVGLLVHEMLHVILQHDHRAFPTENLYLQNLAQDMVVNAYIHAHGQTFFSRKKMSQRDVPRLILPKGLPVVPEAFYHQTAISDPSWEDVYQWLKTCGPRKLLDFVGHIKDTNEAEGALDYITAQNGLKDALQDVPPQDPPFPDNDIAGNLTEKGLIFVSEEGHALPTGMHRFKTRLERRQMTSNARRILCLAGKDNDCREERFFEEINGLLDRVEKVEISSWQKTLKSQIDHFSQSSQWKYSINRLNRRFVSSGLYVAGRMLDEQQWLTVVVDVSASMVLVPEDLRKAFGVIETLIGKYRINLLCIDETLFVPIKKDRHLIAPKGKTAPKRYLYQRGDWQAIKTGISGTTYFAPLFNHYMQHHTETLLVLTDGYIYDLDRLKPYPGTLWVIAGNRQEPFHPPFGRVVPMTDEK